jgi:ribonucleoside-diphosphate reductase alpha chain
VRAISSAATVTALKTVSSEQREEATAFRRDYEERAKELAEEIAHETAVEQTSETIAGELESALASAFTADAAKEAADAKALAAERRAKAVMQGYTGNMCTECQNFTMVRNGTCEKCDTCGSTSGCS